MEEFLIRAFLAAMAIAIVAGPLGCFIIWKKMAYFGDSLAHSSLLGVSLGLIFGLNLNISILLITLFFAGLLMFLQAKSALALDSILGVIAHILLALGVVLLYVLTDGNFDLHSFLFGDILLISWFDLIWIYTAVAITLSLLILNWSALVFYVVNKDLAKSYGIKTLYLELMFHFLIALVVSISIQMIGALLITSLLIIPSASAKLVAKSSKTMALFASIIALIASFFGLLFSIYFDSPSGPSIVLCLGFGFILLFIYSRLVIRMNHD